MVEMIWITVEKPSWNEWDGGAPGDFDWGFTCGEEDVVREFIDEGLADDEGFEELDLEAQMEVINQWVEAHWNDLDWERNEPDWGD